ncbi:hypothetical protein Q3G72_022035 [Acer saccharum]|nr:hypothetical protein Q3G72_022035 [Acer saccharum]
MRIEKKLLYQIISQGSVGTNAFIAPLVQYKPHDDHLGLRWRRRTNVSYSEDDRHQETHIQNDDHFPDDDSEDEEYAASTPHDCHSGFHQMSLDGVTLDLNSWFRGDDYYLGEGVDEVSQMISPPTVIAEARTNCNLNLGTASFVTARHTEAYVSSILFFQRINPLRIDIPEGNSNSNDEEVHDWSQKMDFEWIFVITNIVLESMSAIFTQLSSKQKPQYALLGMLLSYLALLTCIIELIYEGRRHRQIPIGRTRRGKSFATLNNIVALACALAQCVVTTINYSFQSPIKLTVSPIILANGVLFSKILKYRQREAL